MSKLPCPGCEGESISPDCGLCGGSGWLPDATPVVRRFLAPAHTLDLDSPETVERLARALDSLDGQSAGYWDRRRDPAVLLTNAGLAVAILAALREGTA